MKKIAIVGAHGVGKSKICKEVKNKLLEKIGWEKVCYNIVFIPEQFREVAKDIPNFTKQTENITLETYARQLALECRYAEQGKENILCDRSVYDTFIYHSYLVGKIEPYGTLYAAREQADFWTSNFYNKIYLIEPSDRPIENDGFRLTDKKQQLEIHELFLQHFKDFDNIEIINQEEAHKEEFVEKVANEFVL